MNQARSLVSTQPANEEDLGNLMEVIRGYAVVEPEAAFRLAEPLMDEFSQVIQASAVLSKYERRGRAFKDGELLLSVTGALPPSLLLFRYLPQISILAAADLESTGRLVDRLQRNDARSLVRLLAVQAAVDPAKKR